MQHVRKLPLLVLVLFVACISAGALSPEGAAHELRRVFTEGDARGLKMLLSEKSRVKVRVMVTSLKSLEGKQLQNVAAYYGVKPGELSVLTVDVFLASYINRESGRVLGKVLQSKIAGIDRQKTRARVHFSGGAALDFVREGPYWKFDMTKL